MNDPTLLGALRELRTAHRDHIDAVERYNAAASLVTASTERLSKALGDVRSLVATSDDPELEVPA